MTTLQILLYVLGAVLELIGILTVAFEIRGDRERAVAIAARKRPLLGESPGSHLGQFTVLGAHEARTDPAGVAHREATAARNVQQRTALKVAGELDQIKSDLLAIVSTGLRRRAFGVGLLVLGLLLGTAGNIISATRG
jgi:hypothetical protein